MAVSLRGVFIRPSEAAIGVIGCAAGLFFVAVVVLPKACAINKTAIDLY